LHLSSYVSTESTKYFDKLLHIFTLLYWTPFCLNNRCDCNSWRFYLWLLNLLWITQLKVKCSKLFIIKGCMNWNANVSIFNFLNAVLHVLVCFIPIIIIIAVFSILRIVPENYPECFNITTVRHIPYCKMVFFISGLKF
jgi:hypothetical protein